MFLSRTLSLALSLALASTVAYAQEESADALITRALALRAADREEEAHPLLLRAFEMSGTPRARAQLALSHQALGHWREAYEGLQTALAADDPWIAGRRAALEEALATVRTQLAFLNVVGEPSGAEIRVGGEAVGALPLEAPIALSPGAISFEVRAGGYASFTRELTLRAGETHLERVALLPGGGGGEAPWAIAGASGLVLIGGAILLGVGLADIEAIENSEVGTPWSDVREAADRAVILADVGIVALTVGVVGVGLGILLWALDGGGSASAARDLTIRF